MERNGEIEFKVLVVKSLGNKLLGYSSLWEDNIEFHLMKIHSGGF